MLIVVVVPNTLRFPLIDRFWAIVTFDTVILLAVKEEVDIVFVLKAGVVREFVTIFEAEIVSLDIIETFANGDVNDVLTTTFDESIVLLYNVVLLSVSKYALEPVIVTARTLDVFIFTYETFEPTESNTGAFDEITEKFE